MSDQEVLFPGAKVELLGGQEVTIKPWGMKVGFELLPIVGELLDVSTKSRDSDGNVNASSILVNGSDKMKVIVMKTLDWTDEDFEKLAFEDLFTLAQGVMDVCILREDSGGIAGKLMGLLGDSVRGLIEEAVTRSSEINAKATTLAATQGKKKAKRSGR